MGSSRAISKVRGYLRALVHAQRFTKGDLIQLLRNVLWNSIYALEDMVEAMKSDIRYAENTVNYDDDKLKLIGWAGRKAATPLAVPSQTRLLEAPKQGAGWLFLDWKKPSDGGAVSAYKVMRRERPDGP